MKIKITNKNGIVRITKDSGNGYETLMFKVLDGETATIDIKSFIGIDGDGTKKEKL